MNPFISAIQRENPRPNHSLDMHIPVGKAWICMSCQQVHTGWKCPACGSHTDSYPLTKFMGEVEG